MIALSSRPSVQYARPRPESLRGAASPRLPSFSLCIHSISPVAASSATTARRVPAVEYSTPLDHQRRRLEVELRPRAERVGLEPPGDFELVEVVRVDLIERRVARVAEIAAVGPPLAVRRAVLRKRSDDERRTRDVNRRMDLIGPLKARH